MAEAHDALVRIYRKKVLKGGLKETKSPMPSYRPDIFAERVSQSGKVIEQVAVEAEIASTLSNEHTSHQLLHLDDFIRHQKSKRIVVRGYLLIPRKKEARILAALILESLFPYGTSIRLLESA